MLKQGKEKKNNCAYDKIDSPNISVFSMYIENEEISWWYLEETVNSVQYCDVQAYPMHTLSFIVQNKAEYVYKFLFVSIQYTVDMTTCVNGMNKKRCCLKLLYKRRGKRAVF